MFPPKTEKPDFLGFHPARASGERFRGPLALVWPVGEGCYLVPGEPIAPGEKGLIDERTDYESSDDQGRQRDDLRNGHGHSGGVLHRNPRAPPSVPGWKDHFAMIDVGDGAVKLAFLSDPDGTGLYLCEAAQPL